MGCGSGQSTRAFAPYFSKITGIDTSSSQVAAAKESEVMSHISYKVGTAEELSLPANSVDLINSTQAAHWFNLQKFFAEADRALKPSGVIALNSYSIPRLYSFTDDSVSAKLTEVIDNHRWETLKNYWDEARGIVDRFYAEIKIPYENCCAFRNDDSLNYKLNNVTISSVIGYLSSWSAYHTYLKETSDTELLQKVQNELLSAMGETDPDVACIKMEFPVTLIMGKKPTLL